MLFAGHGTNDHRWDKGNGGNIELIAGEDMERIEKLKMGDTIVH